MRSHLNLRTCFFLGLTLALVACQEDPPAASSPSMRSKSAVKAAGSSPQPESSAANTETPPSAGPALKAQRQTAQVQPTQPSRNQVQQPTVRANPSPQDLRVQPRHQLRPGVQITTHRAGDKRVMAPGITTEDVATKIRTATQPLVVHLWATWCGPCKEEWPTLVEWATKNPKVDILAVSVDPPFLSEKILPFAKDLPPNMTVKHWRDKDRQALLKVINAGDWDGALPANFVFLGGRQRKRLPGVVEPDAISKAIAEALAGP